MEKRRGRPPGTKKQEVKLEVSIAEPKKRGRKAVQKIFIVPTIDALEGEFEGSTSEKLKIYADQAVLLAQDIDKDPWRMDYREKYRNTISRMCSLIQEL